MFLVNFLTKESKNFKNVCVNISQQRELQIKLLSCTGNVDNPVFLTTDLGI